jgi:hypothetical protein
VVDPDKPLQTKLIILAMIITIFFSGWLQPYPQSLDLAVKGCPALPDLFGVSVRKKNAGVVVLLKPFSLVE